MSHPDGTESHGQLPQKYFPHLHSISSISKDLQKQHFCHCLSLAFHLTSRRKFNKGLNRFHIYTCCSHTHIFSQLRRKKRVQTTALREAARGFKPHAGSCSPGGQGCATHWALRHVLECFYFRPHDTKFLRYTECPVISRHSRYLSFLTYILILACLSLLAGLNLTHCFLSYQLTSRWTF